MTVFMLSHYDARDYYVTQRTDLGVYSTREKAIEKIKQAHEEGRYRGALDGDELWFDIVEWTVQ